MGASPGDVNKSPLHFTALYDQPVAVQELRGGYADSSAINANEFTALHDAVACGNEKALLALVSPGQGASDPNPSSRSCAEVSAPLRLAAGLESSRTVEVLLQRGA